jgi:sulfhydrogenase subunit beta (sulfur reductase)
MPSRILKKQSLGPLFEKLRGGGRRIFAPRTQGAQVTFQEVTTPADVAAVPVQTTLSAKAAAFPRCETLFSYKQEGADVKVQDPPADETPLVLFGLRPCDAASFAVLNSVFTWDYQDELFKRRLARMTVVSVACTTADEYCFCTSVGGGPGDIKGSDILLTPIENDAYLADILTPKGEALVALAPELFGAAPPQLNKDKYLAKVSPRFDYKKLRQRLPELFKNDAVWVEQSLRCLGCGACAFVCPTCVCFDIQDEPGKDGGVRLRCWDSCGFSLFTLHTSGHNPRSVQSQRWRQRVMHKFSYFEDRLGFIGCVGCGRCSRSCPADMNLVEHLVSLAEAK